MQRSDQWFSFEHLDFSRTHAHGGTLPILTRRVRAGGAGRAYNFIDLTILPPGADIGIHRHTEDNEEVYVIISGRGMMTLDGSEFEVESGCVVVNRPAGTHALRNIGDSELRLVVLEAPVAVKDAHS
jgi:mannose-6-phosphate isomerase-like protein (cupin superfamily)